MTILSLYQLLFFLINLDFNCSKTFNAISSFNKIQLIPYINGAIITDISITTIWLLIIDFIIIIGIAIHNTEIRYFFKDEVIYCILISLHSLFIAIASIITNIDSVMHHAIAAPIYDILGTNIIFNNMLTIALIVCIFNATFSFLLEFD